MAYIWPIGLVVISNIIYQICAKSVPSTINPLASLTVTYLVSAATSAILYFALNTPNANLLREYSQLNWASFVLGIFVIGLEAGFIYAYKAGWEVSTVSLVQSIFVAVVLIFVGILLYREALTWNKIVGVVICLIGMVFINK